MKILKRTTLVKSPSTFTLLVLAAAWFCGCTTVQIYQSPVSEFQTAVNSANDAIRPYLLEVNNLNAKANLYDKVNLAQAWGTEDLKPGIPGAEIQVRLQALSTLASYANALGAMATSKDVDELGKAAKTLGTDVNGLSSTVSTLTAKRQAAGGQSGLARQAAKFDIGSPVQALVTLFGTLMIEHKEKKATEAAIINGEKPVNEILDLLKADLRALTLVDQVSYAAMQAGMVKTYNDARNKSDPQGLMALIDQFVADNNRILTLQALQVDSLLSDMKSAHAALVTFAKSSKKPKDLSQLSGQINVFTAHVKLFQDAVTSIEPLTHSK